MKWKKGNLIRSDFTKTLRGEKSNSTPGQVLGPLDKRDFKKIESVEIRLLDWTKAFFTEQQLSKLFSSYDPKV